MPSVEEAVRLLTSQPHALRYVFSTHEELTVFIDAVRTGLGYDAGQLRWRPAGILTNEHVAVLWMGSHEAPADFA